MSAPRFSIVMPSLNQAGFLVHAVESIKNQTYSDWELVVQDGSSRDGSVEILKNFSDKDPRIHWHSEPDKGPADAINKAFAHTEGRWIGWLNADDLYAKDALQTVEQTAASHDEDLLLIYGEARHMDAKGTVLGRYPTLPANTPISEFQKGCFLCQPAVFFRREAFEALGGLNDSFRASFDFDLWVRFFTRFPGRLKYLSKLLAYSRLHENTITFRNRETVAIEGVNILRRHLGAASSSWLLSCWNEILVESSKKMDSGGVRNRCREILEKATRDLSEVQLRELALFLDQWRTLQWAERGVFINTTIDGWSGFSTRIVFRQPAKAWGTMALKCVPFEGLREPVTGKIFVPGHEVIDFAFPPVEPFHLKIPIAKVPVGTIGRIHILCSTVASPTECNRNNPDARLLAFRIEDLEMENPPDSQNLQR